MSMVVGLFNTRNEATKAVEALRRANFRAENVSVVIRDRSEPENPGAEVGMGDASAVGAAGGGVLGGLTGLLVGVGALAIPGIGPVLAAGPLAAAIAGSAIGVATGGIIGSLIDVGVSEEAAKLYHEGVASGAVLVTVHAPEGREEEARAVLKEHGMRAVEEPPAHVEKAAAEAHHTRHPANAEMDGIILAGGASGGVLGGIIGALVGGPVGATAGVAIGVLAGGATGAAYEYSMVEPLLRADWEKSEHAQSVPWDRAAPALRYGWESHDRPELRAESWSEARAALERHWPAKEAWKAHEPIVRFAWERRLLVIRQKQSGQASSAEAPKPKEG